MGCRDLVDATSGDEERAVECGDGGGGRMVVVWPLSAATCDVIVRHILASFEVAASDWEVLVFVALCVHFKSELKP